MNRFSLIRRRPKGPALAVTSSDRRGALVATLALSLLVVSAPAHAGTGGTEFAAIWTTLSGWMEGILGRIAAGGMVLVGLFMGLVRQSLTGFIAGIGGALGVFTAPAVINGIVTGTVAVDPAVLETLPAAVDLLAAVAAL
jgi:conjugal transfer pilus assembly protein TraA